MSLELVVTDVMLIGKSRFIFRDKKYCLVFIGSVDINLIAKVVVMIVVTHALMLCIFESVLRL